MKEVLNLIYYFFNTIFILFIPGLSIIMVMSQFVRISIFEKILFSFIISITLIPLLVFNLNLFLGININKANVMIIIISIFLIGTVIICCLKGIKNKFFKKFY